MDGSNEFTYSDKNALRKELLKMRAAVDDRRERERAVTQKLLTILKGSCMIYVSIGSELSTHGVIDALLKSGAGVYAPYTSNGEIVPRRLIKLGDADSWGNCPRDCYGDGQAVQKIDICVTPLLGFNGNGYRLGYGKGCYDKFFDKHDVYKIGVAFDVQRVDFLPQAHDVPLDCCITESGVVYFNHARHIG